MNNDTIILYTDGSCLGNPGPGGWAGILKWGDVRKEISGGYKKTTNNRMELIAVINSLSILTRPCKVKVYTDSQYVKNAITNKWINNWMRNGWKTSDKKPVKNRDLWEKLIPLINIHKVEFCWVKGHNGDSENEKCDRLAVTAANNTSNLVDDMNYEE